jgi:ribonuclease T2
MKTSLTVALSVALFAVAGYSNSAPGPATDSQSMAQTANATTPKATAPGQPYDFYLLNLSWSPEFCSTQPTSPECAAHPGFVVHGLWPQNNNGTYPQNCGSRPGPTDADWQGLMPTASLAQHEWQTHGTCTPYDAATYFGLIRKAFNEVKIPADFNGNTQPASEPPAAIIGDFAKSNATFPSGSIAVSCGNNALTAMEFCFDKNLNPEACQSVKACGANTVKIPPR